MGSSQARWEAVGFGHKGVAVTLVGDCHQHPPSGEAEVEEQRAGEHMGDQEVEAGLVRNRVLGEHPLLLRMKENLMCDKQEKQVDKLQADEPDSLVGPA